MTQKIDFLKCTLEEQQYLLEAVKQNGYVIEYINNPSESVQLEAVKQNGCAIECINNPSEEAMQVSKMTFLEKFNYFNKGSNK